MDDKTKSELRRCSKAELLYIIEKMCLWGMNAGQSHLRRALSDIKLEKELRRLDEADEYNKLAHSKRLKYIELLSSFEGKSVSEIPQAALEKAEKLRKEAQAADRKWNKLMGVKEK